MKPNTLDSLPGGNQVDGLPPAHSFRASVNKTEIGTRLKKAWEIRSFRASRNELVKWKLMWKWKWTWTCKWKWSEVTNHWRSSNNQENIKFLKHQFYMIYFDEKDTLNDPRVLRTLPSLNKAMWLKRRSRDHLELTILFKKSIVYDSLGWNLIR